MSLEKKLTVRARLILFCADHVLVAHHKPTNTYFMPGGGVEHGESSIACLRREIVEECDLELPSELVPFGILENRFEENGRDIHEILIHFGASLKDSTPRTVMTREADLKFEWLPLTKMTETEIWPPETYSAIRKANSDMTGFHYAPLS